jgi:hypothetical protein
MQNPSEHGYSPTVRLWLECSSGIIPLSHVAPDWIIPQEPIALPPTPGVVVVEVDGIQHRRPVHLAQGISTSSRRATVQPQATAA